MSRCRFPCRAAFNRPGGEARLFPLYLGVKYSVGAGPYAQVGVGLTTGMGNSQVHLSVDHSLAVGDHIQLAITWPAHLNGSIPLQLIVDGCITTSSDFDAVVSIERYEFRTRALGNAPS